MEDFVRTGEGLEEVPSEAATKPLRSLDVSNNKIKALSPGLFASLGSSLVSFNIASNALSALPDEIGQLRSLKSLDASSNQLASLPAGIWALGGLEVLRLGHNLLAAVPEEVMNLMKLQVLDISHNELVTVPAEVGWLPLQQLSIEGNAKLRIPKIVVEGGFRAIMSYLQVICEQHRLVEQHLDKFATPGQEGGAPAPTAKPFVPPTDPEAVGTIVRTRIKEATTSGIMDLRYIATPAAVESLVKLPAVYVADVRHNAWRDLPGGVLGLPQLVVLNASDNGIESVGEGVVPEHLGVLNLSFNRLTTLPKALGKAPVLQQMYLANNQLSDLPDSFAALPMVDLFLSENLFTTIPKAVLSMAQLSKLSIACCRLREVPGGLCKVVTLRFLDLSFNELKTLPPTLSSLVNLNALNLSFNPLAGFPDVIFALASLLELNLDYSGVKDVPPGIGNLRRLEGLQMEGCTLPSPLDAVYQANPLQLVQLHNTALTSLDLSDLSLPKFPPQLTGLTTLKALNLAKNQITELPKELGKMTHLTALNLSHNPLRQPYARIAEMVGDLSLVEFCNRASERLDLTNCGFEQLPEEVRPHAELLQQLKLAHNKLKALPGWISEFKSLNTAVLDNNELTELPEVLLSLPKIAIIMASVNHISALPPNIGDFGSIQALVLQSNLLTSLPASLTRLTDLKALSMASNQLTEIPDNIGACVSLRLLDLSSNSLTSLPSSIGTLPRLKTLKVSGNRLASVPAAELLLAPQLAEVAFAGNPLQGVKDPNAQLNATDAAGVKRVLGLLQAAAPPPAPATAAAPAAAPATAAAAPATAAAAPAASASGRKEESDARELITRISRLEEEAQRPATPQPASAPIHTEESAQAQEQRRAAEAAQAKKEAEVETHTKWLYVQKHLETVAKDHLRPKKGWDSIPLMHVPRIIAAISNPPPAPPRPESGGGGIGADGKPMRPQTLHRFKRVVEQSNMAMQLLNRVNDALHASPGAKGSPVTPPGGGRSGSTPATEAPPLVPPPPVLTNSPSKGYGLQPQGSGAYGGSGEMLANGSGNSSPMAGRTPSQFMPPPGSYAVVYYPGAPPPGVPPPGGFYPPQPYPYPAPGSAGFPPGPEQSGQSGFYQYPPPPYGYAPPPPQAPQPYTYTSPKTPKVKPDPHSRQTLTMVGNKVRPHE